nr:hypothetical protein [uncultured Kingella sp.]
MKANCGAWDWCECNGVKQRRKKYYAKTDGLKRFQAALLHWGSLKAMCHRKQHSNMERRRLVAKWYWETLGAGIGSSGVCCQDVGEPLTIHWRTDTHNQGSLKTN